jgi:hypothetical protein
MFELDEYRKTMDEIVRSKEYAPNVSTIWDLKRIDFKAAPKGMEKTLVNVRKSYPERRGAKIAYVVDSTLGFGMIRMLETLIGDGEAHQKVFYNECEAEKWLTGTA